MARRPTAEQPAIEYDHTILAAYAPQNEDNSNKEEHEQKLILFWDTVLTWLLTTPTRSRLFFLSDANAHVGRIKLEGGVTQMSELFLGTIGTGFSEEANINGANFATVCHMASMYVANIDKKWSPGPTHANGHRLDYIAVEKNLEAKVTASFTDKPLG